MAYTKEEIELNIDPIRSKIVPVIINLNGVKYAVVGNEIMKIVKSK